jgi:hypothetical protein
MKATHPVSQSRLGGLVIHPSQEGTCLSTYCVLLHSYSKVSLDCQSRERGAMSSGLISIVCGRSRRLLPYGGWIPAFAGMTWSRVAIAVQGGVNRARGRCDESYTPRLTKPPKRPCDPPLSRRDLFVHVVRFAAFLQQGKSGLPVTGEGGHV